MQSIQSRLIPIALVLFSYSAFSQSEKLGVIDITDIHSAYVDRPGDLYILQTNNTLKKFDTLGKLIHEQKFEQYPTTFDPRDGARMFFYSNKTQRCSFFSQETKQEFIIEPHYAVNPTLVCSAGDNQLWILDQSDWSLKRVHPGQSRVLVESQIDQAQFNGSPEITFMREYQNFLFVIEKNTGILIFNSLGLQIKKLELPGITHFNFLGEELYYKKNDSLVFYDLFDTSMREVPIDSACQFALLTDLRTYLIYDTRVEILEKL